MKLRSYACTHGGPGGYGNQDSYFSDDNIGLYIVADGLGGSRGGGVASSLAVQSIAEYIHRRPPENDAEIKPYLQKVIRRANEVLTARGKAESSYRYMGTTLTLLMLREKCFYMLNIGDSRGYILQNGSLRQITEDHSVAFEQYLAGAITKEEAGRHPNQKFLTRSLSAARDFAVPDIFISEFETKDIFFAGNRWCNQGIIRQKKSRKSFKPVQIQR